MIRAQKKGMDSTAGKVQCENVYVELMGTNQGSWKTGLSISRNRFIGLFFTMNSEVHVTTSGVTPATSVLSQASGVGDSMLDLSMFVQQEIECHMDQPLSLDLAPFPPEYSKPVQTDEDLDRLFLPPDFAVPFHPPPEESISPNLIFFWILFCRLQEKHKEGEMNHKRKKQQCYELIELEKQIRREIKHRKKEKYIYIRLEAERVRKAEICAQESDELRNERLEGMREAAVARSLRETIEEREREEGKGDPSWCLQAIFCQEIEYYVDLTLSPDDAPLPHEQPDPVCSGADLVAFFCHWILSCLPLLHLQIN
ncbi:uncharacterized protein LOC111088197 [Limulus polyphemus]|uniref:Uncharacterized protein LOC111088197 n=1 Tax=Limulus polyphemus TaxID=6850 RepID=A0ABM1TBG4_LIMPO|nr:uncharacterized protein LOC111088197 [Limulus polyphemus]